MTSEESARSAGFTLIELLIVIVVMGILAAIVVFGLGQFRTDAIARACLTDKRSVENAATSYLARNGSDPASLAALVPSYITQLPSSTNYTITYSAGTPANGDFTVTGSAC